MMNVLELTSRLYDGKRQLAVEILPKKESELNDMAISDILQLIINRLKTGKVNDPNCFNLLDDPEIVSEINYRYATEYGQHRLKLDYLNKETKNEFCFHTTLDKNGIALNVHEEKHQPQIDHMLELLVNAQHKINLIKSKKETINGIVLWSIIIAITLFIIF